VVQKYREHHRQFELLVGSEARDRQSEGDYIEIAPHGWSIAPLWQKVRRKCSIAESKGRGKKQDLAWRRGMRCVMPLSAVVSAAIVLAACRKPVPALNLGYEKLYIHL
jgi:hypothetical protein